MKRTVYLPISSMSCLILQHNSDAKFVFSNRSLNTIGSVNEQILYKSIMLFLTVLFDANCQIPKRFRI